MNIPSEVYFIAGVLVGILAVRYGIGLGMKLTCQVQEDMVLPGRPTEQDFTGDDDVRAG